MLLRHLRGLATALSLALAVPAWGHHVSSHAAEGGIAIPALTHGQMAVIADHRSDITALAERVGRTDPVFRRLANFVRIQRAYCLWILMPGSVSDEASPFNECAHATLAGQLALLLHMHGMEGADPAIGPLVGRIDEEMLVRGTALALCRYSAESFSTSEIVRPSLGAIPFHLPSLAPLAAMLAACLLGLALLAGPRRLR